MLLVVTFIYHYTAVPTWYNSINFPRHSTEDIMPNRYIQLTCSCSSCHGACQSL